ncbi:MAG: sigma-70 family RNA polymerase sigma factor [bacterium]
MFKGHQDEKILQLVKDTLIDIRNFDKLYRIFVDRIFSYCYFRVSNKDTASDLTSDIFLKTFKAFSEKKFKLDEKIGFEPWLYRIAHNRIVDLYKTNSQKKFVDLDKVINEFSEENLSEIENNLDISKSISKVMEVISKMDDQVQTIFVLKFKEDYSFNQISKVLEINESTIKMKYYRSLAYIKIHIK